MKDVCVLVFGSECSGSKLVCRILAHVLGIYEYGSENYTGDGDVEDESRSIVHRSFPYGQRLEGQPAFMPNPIELINEANEKHDRVYIVITTRDRSASLLCKEKNHSHLQEAALTEMQAAENALKFLLKKDLYSFIFSYETFMLLGTDYLQLLYEKLDLDSDFCPELIDGNAKYLK